MVSSDSIVSFSDLGLVEPLLRSVQTEGYSVPTPIQAKAISPILQGREVLGCAQTGTGKTAAFALPILNHMATVPAPTGPRKPRVLVLSPTRELSAQIDESFRTYGQFLHLRSTVIFGGVSQHRQEQALKHGVDVIVATPGRLLDLVTQRIADLRHVEVLVLDECDQMLDMGFIHDIRKIVAHLPPKRQNLMFSATMPQEIRQLANTILKDPVSVQVTPVSSTVQRVEQSVYFVERRNKATLLTHFIQENETSRVLVFTRTKHGADKVARHLERCGIPSAAIHGNKNQNARNRALAAFKSKSPPVLVATDIAARGLDIDSVSHVVNFDVPNIPETYVHRIGRTARAGASGVAVSFCDAEERSFWRDIEKLTRQQITVRKDQPEYPASTPAAAPMPRPHAPAHRPAHPPKSSEHSRESSHPRSSHPQPRHGGPRSHAAPFRGPKRAGRPHRHHNTSRPR